MKRIAQGQRIELLLALTITALASCANSAFAADAPALPPFQELRDLLRERFPDINEQSLNDAAVRGLINAFPSRIQIGRAHV